MNGLFLAFIGYIIFAGNFNAPPKEAAVPEASTTAPASYPHLNTLTRASSWQKALNTDQVAGCGAPPMPELQTILLRVGEEKSNAADCATPITLTLQKLEKNGTFGGVVRKKITLKTLKTNDPLRHSAYGIRRGEARLMVVESSDPTLLHRAD
jgi:hypothetical protein